MAHGQDWHWVIADPNGGDPVYDLVRARSRSMTFHLDQPHETNFALSGRDPGALELGLGLESDILVYRDDDLLLRSRLLTPRDTISLDDHTEVQCRALSYKGVLDRRIIWDFFGFPDDEQEEIAWEIIQHTQGQDDGDLGITREGTPTGITRAREYEPGQNVLARINDLADSEDGFEWDITPEHVFQVWHPRRGDEDVGVLLYGSNVVAVERVFESQSFSNANRYSATDLAFVEKYTPIFGVGRWEQQVGVTEAEDETELNEMAEGLHAKAAAFLPTWNVELRPGHWPEMWLGDTTRLIIPRTGRLEVDTVVRVQEISVTVNDEDVPFVTLRLGTPYRRLEHEFSDLRRRLTRLER